MSVGTLAQIRRYPVKSMGGEVLDSASLTATGVPGDRCWAVRDETKGGIRGAKKIPALMTLGAHFAEPPSQNGSSPAVIELPDGTSVATGDTDVNERVSAAVGTSVSLWPLLPADALDHYRRGTPTHEDLETELRATFARTADEPLPDLSLFPPEIFEYESPPGTYFDAFPILLMTDASLRSMQERAPSSRFDIRRFRPNLLVETAEDADGFPELSWRGSRLRIGDVTLKIEIECPRCVMTTHGFEDLPKDPAVMRALVKEAGGNLGVYASVEVPGTIRTGDEVDLLQ